VQHTEGAVLDGRVQRTVRSRAAVVDAILDLLSEGHAQPTAQMVAERSGVSVRSIFRLFDDMASLHRAAASRQADRVRALLVPLPGDGPLAERVAALVANHRNVYETISPVRRVAVQAAATSPPIADELARVAELFRGQVKSTFRAELAGTGPEVLDALDLAASWEAWERLRTVQGLDVDAAAAAVTCTLTALATADR
jgi:AcrR family transcriptional regulator